MSAVPEEAFKVRRNHQRLVWALLFVLTLAAPAIVLLVGATNSSSESPLVRTSDKSTQITQRHSPIVLGVARGIVDQATLKHHAAFLSRGREVHVYRGLAVAGSFMARDAMTGVQPKTPKTCAVVTGDDFTAATCRRNAFGPSNLFFLKSAAGGPVARDRTELQIAGLASPRVGRVEAIDSTGVTHVAQLANGAFLVELSREALADGVEISTLRVYSVSGGLIESVSL